MRHSRVVVETAASLTSYKRDLLWAVYRANQANDTPVGADVKRELEALGRINTEGGQFSPRLNKPVEQDPLRKADHSNDQRGFTCALTPEGKTVLTQLFVQNAESLDIDLSEFDSLPTQCPELHVSPRTAQNVRHANLPARPMSGCCHPLIGPTVGPPKQRLSLSSRRSSRPLTIPNRKHSRESMTPDTPSHEARPEQFDDYIEQRIHEATTPRQEHIADLKTGVEVRHTELAAGRAGGDAQ